MQLLPADLKIDAEVANYSAENADNNNLTLNSHFAQTLKQSRANELSSLAMAQRSEQMPEDIEVTEDQIHLDAQATPGGSSKQTILQTSGNLLPAGGIQLPPSNDEAELSLSNQVRAGSVLQTQTPMNAATEATLPGERVDLSTIEIRQGKSSLLMSESAVVGAEEGVFTQTLPRAEQSSVTLQQPREQRLAHPVDAPRMGRHDISLTAATPRNTGTQPEGQQREPSLAASGLNIRATQLDLRKLAMDADARQPEQPAPSHTKPVVQRSVAAPQIRISREPLTPLQSQSTDMSAGLLTHRNSAESASRTTTAPTSIGVQTSAMNITSGVFPSEPGQALRERLEMLQTNPVLDTTKMPTDQQAELTGKKINQTIMPGSLKHSVADVQSIERDNQAVFNPRVAKFETDSVMETLPNQSRQNFIQTPAANHQTAPVNPMMAAWASRETSADSKSHTEFNLTLSTAGLKSNPSSAEKPAATTPSAALSATAMNKALGENVSDQLMRAVSRQALTSGRFTLQLNPRELGAVDIEFSTERGELQLAVIVRESTTRELVEQNLARLRQTLQEAGVNLGELDVRQEQQQQQNTTKPPQPQGSAQGAHAPDHETQPTTPSTRASERLFDIYV